MPRRVPHGELSAPSAVEADEEIQWADARDGRSPTSRARTYLYNTYTHSHQGERAALLALQASATKPIAFLASHALHLTKILMPNVRHCWFII